MSQCIRHEKSSFHFESNVKLQSTMHYQTLKVLNTCCLLFAHTSRSVVGEQWEIGTWAPDAVVISTSNPPSVSPTTAMPTSLVRESSGDSLSPTLIDTPASPSMEPSDSPSKRPSNSPTASIAPSISFAPYSVTIPPSTAPSQLPSMMPTPQCHDLASYRSPLNSLNCTQHSGTDCFEWEHLGLTALEVEQLIVSCPITCGIECDSLIVFETNLTYRLLSVDNFLSPESTTMFEEASADYIENYVLSKNTQNRFSLNRVLLLSQRMIEKVGPTRQLIRTLQTLDSHLVDLEINVALQGFVVHTDIQTLEMYIIEGIETFGYMRALRFTNDPALQEVEVLVNAGLNAAAPSPTVITTDRESNNSSPWIITVAVLSCTGIAVFVVVYIRLQRSTSPTQSEKDCDPPVISPAPSTRSNIAPNFSYESIVRFTPNSFGQRSGTSVVDSTGDESSLKTSPNASMLSTTESGEEEHPLTGIVPSMIVYDFIDGTDELLRTADPISLKDKVKNVVPTRHVAATVSFRKALQENSLEALDMSTFVGIPDSFTPSAVGETTLGLPEGIKKPLEKIALPKQLSEGEATSASDATTVRTGAGERDAMEMSGLTHGSFHTSAAVRVEPNTEKTNSTNTRHQRYLMQLGTGGSWIKINAPRAGKLGLVIQSSESHGHVVIQVKHYSPLKDDIEVGDRIICIDGRDTTGMSLTKVTKLISGTNDELSSLEGIIEILAWRPSTEILHKGGIEIPHVQKSKGSGHQRSGSSSSTRSAISAPPLGSYRSQQDYHRHTTTAHRSRKTTSKVSRSGQNQNHVFSYASTRSSSSTPNEYRHDRSNRITKMPPAVRQSVSSRHSDTYVDSRRRITPPMTIPTSSRSVPKQQSAPRDSDEC